MRSVILFVTTAAVIALAVWAYQENYSTQHVIVQTEKLERQIGEKRARLAVLKAEWAYLNRPDRLRDLAEINYDELQLLPLRPAQFGRVDQVSFPERDDLFDLDGTVEVMSKGARP